MHWQKGQTEVSMISEYRQLTPAELDKLSRNPDNVEEFLEEFDADDEFEDDFDDDDDDDFGDDEESGGSSSSGADEDEDEEDDDEDEDYARDRDDDGAGTMGKYFSLDKSWHALHFLLNDHPWEGSGPLFDAILGGTEIGEDMGYGPPRVLTPNEVRAVAAALNKLDKAALKKKFDPKAMEKHEIYVGTQDFAELSGRLKDLTTFFEEASENGNGMLLILS
jgi:hypothetical protein